MHFFLLTRKHVRESQTALTTYGPPKHRQTKMRREEARQGIGRQTHTHCLALVLTMAEKERERERDADVLISIPLFSVLNCCTLSLVFTRDFADPPASVTARRRTRTHRGSVSLFLSPRVLSLLISFRFLSVVGSPEGEVIRKRKKGKGNE